LTSWFLNGISTFKIGKITKLEILCAERAKLVILRTFEEFCVEEIAAESVPSSAHHAQNSAQFSTLYKKGVLWKVEVCNTYY
jgi:hypothetical protein